MKYKHNEDPKQSAVSKWSRKVEEDARNKVAMERTATRMLAALISMGLEVDTLEELVVTPEEAF